MATFLLLLLLLSALAISTILLLKSRRTCRRPPGPKGLPFIGNLHQVNISKPHIWLAELSRMYGPIIYLKLCRMPVVVISSADAAEKALKHNDVAFAGRPYAIEATVVSTHSRSRSFHHDCYRVSSKANSTDLIDVGDVVSSFNSSVLCRAAFGKRLEQSWKRFDEILSHFMSAIFTTFMADCFVSGLINKISGAARRVEKIFNDMDSFYQQLIDEHLDPKRPDSMNDDILDLLIRLKEDRAAAVQID